MKVRRRQLELALISICGAAVGVVACSSTKPPPAAGSSGETTSGGTSASGGVVAADGAAALDGALAADVEAGTPSGTPCGANDAAFQAAGASFVFPTPPKLAAALNELLYSASSHPVVVSLQSASKRGAIRAAKQDPGTMLWGFTTKVTATSVLLEASGFSFAPPQSASAIQLVDRIGTSELAVGSVSLRGFISEGCATGMFTVDAVLPASEGAHVLHLQAGDFRVDQLLDDPGRDGGAASTGNLRMIFSAATVSFDFTTTMP